MIGNNIKYGDIQKISDNSVDDAFNFYKALNLNKFFIFKLNNTFALVIIESCIRKRTEFFPFVIYKSRKLTFSIPFMTKNIYLLGHFSEIFKALIFIITTYS